MWFTNTSIIIIIITLSAVSGVPNVALACKTTSQIKHFYNQGTLVCLNGVHNGDIVETVVHFTELNNPMHIIL